MELLGITLAYSVKKHRGHKEMETKLVQSHFNAAPLVVLSCALYVRTEIETATKPEK